MRDEIERVVSENIHQDQYAKRYQDIWTGSDEWRAIDAPGTATFPWDADSNYIRRPPYADPQEHNIAAKVALQGMRPFLMLGDNVTTDHISPAGRIPPNSVAGRYLHSRGVRVADFNQYSTRRTNHEVMMRGAFSNPKLVNELVNSHGKASAGCLAWSSTRDRALSPYEAALTYGSTVPLVIVAGKNYGAGSSRDWAAKAPALLGIKAIIAESYERIHRSNLIGMGIYPLQFVNGVTRRDICRDGREVIDVELGELSVGKNAVAMHIHQEDGNTRCFEVLCRIDSAQELAYLAHRGVLRYIVQKTLYRNTPSGI
jgi:aconitate hydratase